MDSLRKKCENIRKSIEEADGKLVDNEIYVILSTNQAESSDFSSGKLLISLFEKIRRAAGAVPSLKHPSIRLVPHMAKIPVDKNCYQQIENEAFVKDMPPISFKKLAEIFEDSSKCYNPLEKIDGNFVNFYGPKPQIMDLSFDGHEKIHLQIEESTSEIIAVQVGHPCDFSHFQTVITAIIHSQKCEKCLLGLLKPIKNYKSVDFFVKNVSRGIWSPRTAREMRLCMDWKQNDRRYKLPCWRLDENMVIPQNNNPPQPPQNHLPTPPKSSKNSEISEKSEKLMNKPAWVQNVTLETIERLGDDIQKLENETDFHRMRNCETNLSKKFQIKWLRSSHIRIFLNEKNEKLLAGIGNFGFETSNLKLNEELEEVVKAILKDFQIELNFKNVLNKLSVEGFRRYHKESRVEQEIVDKIHEKLEETRQKLLNPQAKKSTQPEIIGLSESESDDEDVRIRKKREVIVLSSEDEKEEEKEKVEEEIEEEEEKMEEEVEEIEEIEEIHQEIPFGKLITTENGEKMIKLNENEMDDLSTAFRKGIDMFRLSHKNLPLVRKTPDDEFCMIDGFVSEPGPDLSCGFHGVFTQRVNQEVKKFLDDQGIEEIHEKEYKKLLNFLETQEMAWQKASKDKKNKKLLEVMKPYKTRTSLRKEREAKLARRKPRTDLSFSKNAPKNAPKPTRRAISAGSATSSPAPKKRKVNKKREPKPRAAKTGKPIIDDISPEKEEIEEEEEEEEEEVDPETKKKTQRQTKLADIIKSFERVYLNRAHAIQEGLLPAPDCHYLEAFRDVVPFDKTVVINKMRSILPKDEPPGWVYAPQRLKNKKLALMDGPSPPENEAPSAIEPTTSMRDVHFENRNAPSQSQQPQEQEHQEMEMEQEEENEQLLVVEAVQEKKKRGRPARPSTTQ